MSLSATASAAGNPWLRVLSALEKKITRLSYDTWLKPTRFSHIIGSTIYVRVPTPEFRHIEEKFGDLIQEALDVLSPEYQDVKYITAEEDKTVAPVRPAAGFPPVSASGVPATSGKQQRFDWDTAAQLNSKDTFQAFVSGAGHQLAHPAHPALPGSLSTHTHPAF